MEITSSKYQLKSINKIIYPKKTLLIMYLYIKMHKKLIFSIISILILIMIAASFFFIIKPKLAGNTILTGQAVTDEKEYTYTKAICNVSNFCQDYEIACKNKQVVSQSPITGAVIQHDADWKDPRNQTEFCE
jgi:capsular polysaccharide biosynthesis protein